ncbi:hypothetical protein GCM10007920_46930 [Ciceribacter naphthalenivorans]|uniref:Growth inhibitor PemK n=2 Tax=Alphaproteobacteria TaxID=28211 RepID=A0A512HFY3_9HYPH|nr:hypothetical protein RNA01_12940 [Ciceribacter naphthalenivorans]GLR24899.1 hypothetical protein GCM10007920_46930 [Ciceribacter naphthalenivorans]GLT07755.1 hypothetical protein GCM10007926_46930 [Sphingomonas psychrolutea]
MKRGDVVTVAIFGDFGKPRPAVVIQASAFDATGTATVLLVTSTLTDAPLLRPTIQPDAENGLSKPSPSHGGQGNVGPARACQATTQTARRRYATFHHTGTCRLSRGSLSPSLTLSRP